MAHPNSSGSALGERLVLSSLRRPLPREELVDGGGRARSPECDKAETRGVAVAGYETSRGGGVLGHLESDQTGVLVPIAERRVRPRYTTEREPEIAGAGDGLRSALGSLGI